MKRILTAIFIAMAAISAGSCTDKGALQGEWIIRSVGDMMIQDAEASPSLTFNIETGRIHGYTGVNIVNGEFEREGRKLSLKGLGVTMMAGPEEDMDLERRILDSFNNVTHAKISPEGELQFFNSERDTIMILVRR